MKGLCQTNACSNGGFQDRGCVQHTAIQAKLGVGAARYQCRLSRLIVYVNNRIRISDQVAPGFQGNQDCCELDLVNGALGLYSEAGQNSMLKRA